jgi:hypothetical protein
MVKRFGFFLLIASFFFNKIHACDCGGLLPKWSTDEVMNSSLVFLGKIEDIEGGKASVNVESLFWGLSAPKIEIFFDHLSSCAFQGTIGEFWLFYVNINHEGRFEIDYCGRSRPRVIKGNEDNYAAYSNLDFNSEFTLVKQNFPVKNLVSTEEMQKFYRGELVQIDTRRDLIHPNRNQMVFLVLFSLIAVLIFWKIVSKLK